MAELSVYIPRGLPFSSTAQTFPLPFVTNLKVGRDAGSRAIRAEVTRVARAPHPHFDLIQFDCTMLLPRCI